MTRRLVITYFTITALALASLAVPLGVTFAHREKDRLLFAIERDAAAVAAAVQVPVSAGEPVPRTAILLYAARTGGRVIVVNDRGVALLDTEHPQGSAQNFATNTRPEIIRALAGNSTDGTRPSETLGTALIYAAVPIVGSEGGVKGAVRITYPSATLDARVRRMWSQLALLCLLVLGVVMVVGWQLARSVTRPVRRLEEAADRVASGDLKTRVPERVGPPELRHLELAFNRMASEIARLVAAQQQFVADASHQLRTPLTAVRLRLENLDARIGGAEHPAIETIVADVTRLSRLVDGLLVLARDHTEPRHPEGIDASAVVRERGEAWRDVFEAGGVQLVLDVPQHAWTNVVGGTIEQLVDNLVDNALSVSEPGDTVTVRVLAADSAMIELHVLDHGPGLTAEARERAFDRFWRAADAPSGGSGLGLSIVRRLADASGGTARLDERPEGGIDAVVRLPALEPTPGSPAKL